MSEKIKRAIACLVAVVIMLSATPISEMTEFSTKASAVNTIDSGECGDNVTWTLDSEGTLTISGEGDMYNYGWHADEFDDWYVMQPYSENKYDDEDYLEYGYDARVKKAVIGNGVTSIGNYAFCAFLELKEVIISNSVTRIGRYAFRECCSLTNAIVPCNVASIGDYAFSDCENLTSIDVDSKNQYYSSEDGVLFSKDKTTLIKYPEGNERAKYTISDSVTSIDEDAFCNCTGLMSIIIGDSVTSVDDRAFYKCAKLKSIKIGNKVMSIGDEAFSYCTTLTNITIPDSVTSIGKYAFWNCTSLTKIVIPDSVTKINDDMFAYCHGLESVMIGKGVTSIGDGAFLECTNLTSIDVDSQNQHYLSANGVLFDRNKTTLIQYPAGNNRLEYSIPSSVTSIGDDAFYYCTSLTSITLPDGLTSIGNMAFHYCTSLVSITIPNSVTNIGYEAFDGCTSLKSITIPDSVTSLGDHAFSGCTNLTSVIIENGVTIIDNGMFYDCTSLISVTLPNGIKSIGDFAFYDCTSLINITVLDNVKNIGWSAFEHCTNLTSITIPDSVMSIDSDAFVYCDNLKDVYYQGTSEQWQKVYIECGNECLTNATIHFHTHTLVTVAGKEPTCMEDGYTTGTQCSECKKWLSGHELIEKHHTDNNGDGICDICGKDSRRIIDSGNCGQNDNDITYILYEDGELVVSGYGKIADEAFYDYSYHDDYTDTSVYIKKLTIKNGITDIGESAFEYNEKLINVSIPSSVTNIAEDAFSSCPDIVRLDVENLESWLKTTLEYDANPLNEWRPWRYSDYSDETYANRELYIGGVLAVDIVIPDSITSIGNFALQGCDSIKNVRIPNSVTSVGNCAFKDCSNLQSINITNDVASIGQEAFSGCGTLKSINIPDSTTSIGAAAFNDCVRLESANLPNCIECIKNKTFINCRSLKSINIPESVTKIEWCAFEDCDSITDVIIPKNVSIIDERAFNGCDSLEKINVDENNTQYSSDKYGVLYDKNKTDLLQYPSGGAKIYTIPNTVKSIDYWSLHDCINLTILNIPDSVSEIETDSDEGGEASGTMVLGCRNLENINVDENNTDYSSVDGVLFDKDKTILLRYPMGRNAESYVVPNSVEELSISSFGADSSLKRLILGTNIKNIDSFALADSKIDGIYYCGSEQEWKDNVYYGYNPCGENGDNPIVYYNYKVDEHTHSYTSKITKASTCTSTGIKTYACSCGDTYTETIPATGHTPGSWIIDKQANCKSEGSKHQVCSVCGETIKTKTIVKTEHKYTIKVTSPTCTADGYTTHTCTICGNTYTDTVVKPSGHKAVTVKGKPATCTTNGLTDGTKCSVCGTVIKVQKTIKPTGHSFGSWKVTKKATYTATGAQTRTCSKCKATETKTIAKLKTTAIIKCTLTVKPATYTGKALKPAVTVKIGKITLKSGTHYTVSYKNNTKIGKATITIKGVEKNGYSGIKTLTFNILPANVKNLKATQTTSSIKLTWSKVSGATGYRVFRHDGKKWVKVADTKSSSYTISKLKAGTNYKYAVRAYTTVSKTTYWSTAQTNITTATKPATPALKAKAGAKSATLSWNKNSGATGYEVWMSTKKNGSYSKVATIKKNATVKYTKKSLKKGGTYYFKVRAYKTVDGKNIYSAYSAVKNVKVK